MDYAGQAMQGVLVSFETFRSIKDSIRNISEVSFDLANSMYEEYKRRY